MEGINQIIRTDTFLIILAILSIISIIGMAVTVIKLSNLQKKYKNFMKKLGNGKNIEEDLETYMYRVEKVEKQNAENTAHVKNIYNNLAKCIQKVGIVRYNAFKDTGSNLSFALALLDENNDGVVLNGIYSREMSNIYAKPVEAGKTTYNASEEELQAIKKAIETNNIFKIE